ncbi:hypothetical protein [Humidesulfovibrio idahonensis]
MSGRDISSAVDTAAAQEVVRFFDLARFDFDTGIVRITGAPYDVFYDLDGDGAAEQWKTLMGLGKATGVEDGTELQSYTVTCTLSAIPLEAVSLALAETPQGRPAYIWRAFLDADNTIIDAPVLLFSGRMDVMPLKIGQTAELNLTIGSRLADWDRVRGGRYTDAEQQNRCPGDRFFQFTAQACDKELKWGNS